MSKEGRHLLLSLEISGVDDEAQWDVRMDWETVQRCVSRLAPRREHLIASHLSVKLNIFPIPTDFLLNSETWSRPLTASLRSIA